MSLNDLIIASGYKPDKNKNGINKKFITTLDTLESLGLFEKIQGLYKGDKLCIFKLNIAKFDVNSSFALISLDELDKILNYQYSYKKISYDKILAVLSYIRVNKLRRGKTQKLNPHIKPEFYYRQIKVMAEDLNFSPKLIAFCIDVLQQLEIIVTQTMPRYIDKYGKWHTNVTLFVDKIDDWQQELIWGKELLLTNKKIYNENTK